MVCKYCGCENLEGSTYCVYCGEPLPKQDSSISNILSAYAGVKVEETVSEEHGESGIRVVSAMNRLRRTDMAPGKLHPAEEETVLNESRALLDGVTVAFKEGQAAESLAEEALPEAEMTAEAGQEPALTPQSVSDQAAEIVNRAVEKIVNGTADEADEPDPADKEAETAEPVDPLEQAAAEESGFRRTAVEVPDSPLDFRMDDLSESEPEEPGVKDNQFVKMAASTVVPVKPSRLAGQDTTVTDPVTVARQSAAEFFTEDDTVPASISEKVREVMDEIAAKSQRQETPEPAGDPAQLGFETAVMEKAATTLTAEEAGEEASPEPEQEIGAFEAEPEAAAETPAAEEEPEAAAETLAAEEEPEAAEETPAAKEEPEAAEEEPEAAAEAEPEMKAEAPETDTPEAEEKVPEEEAAPDTVPFIAPAAAATEAAEKLMESVTDVSDAENPEELPRIALTDPEELAEEVQQQLDEKAPGTEAEAEFIPTIPITDPKEIIKEALSEEEKKAERVPGGDSVQEKTDEAKAPGDGSEPPKKKRLWLLFLLLFLLSLVYFLFLQPMLHYQKATRLLEEGKEREALTEFERSGTYKDARTQADQLFAKLTEKGRGQTNIPEGTTTEPVTVPPETSPVETTPEETTPPETTPEETTQEVTTPEETTPEETTPEETTPEETTPEETTPEETTEPAVENPFYYLAEAKVGDIITYGIYEQDDNYLAGPEAIEWIVLAKENDRILVISRQALDSVTYSFMVPVQWETSNARSWLNNAFIKDAFSEEERANILEVTLKNPANPKTNVSGGNDTKDRVFLLSVEEVTRYMTADTIRTRATTHSVTRGAYRNESGEVFWWLRTPGESVTYNAHTVTNGQIDYGGEKGSVNGALRPAMWLNAAQEKYK